MATREEKDTIFAFREGGTLACWRSDFAESISSFDDFSTTGSPVREWCKIIESSSSSTELLETIVPMMAPTAEISLLLFSEGE